MSYRVPAGLSAIYVLAALAGCGGSNPSTGGSAVTSAATSRTTHRAAKPPTRSEALAYARAVVLKASDMAGATVSHEKETSHTRTTAREFDRCERLVSRPRKLVDVSSPTFTRGEELEKEQIGSGVEVVASARTAARAIRLVGNRAVRECLHRALIKSFAGAKLHGARVGPISVTKLPVEAPGATATVGIRMSAAVTFPYSEVTVPIYVDVLGFALGPAEVGMFTTSATQPVPSATEHQLLSVLLSRAESHAL